MQLKLRLGAGESLTIDVKPGDTFQDLSNKVYKEAGIKIDLNQLKSNDVPFDMSTNVIQYFTPKLIKEADKRTPKLCRLCSKPISHDAHFLFEKHQNTVTLADKVNIALPIYVSTKDQLPKQICSFCMKGLNHSFEFVKRVLAAQKNLQNVYSNRQKSSTGTECCPLCQTGSMKQVEPKNGSVAPPSPKREAVVKKEVVIPVPRNLMKPELTEETSSKEFYQDDEVVVGFWDGTIPNKKVELYTTTPITSQLSGDRKYRKKLKTADDDNEWSIEEEYLPISRRGRPKGAKNKPKATPSIVVDKSCAICGWLGPETDMLHHAVNQHCQPDMGYFPCPLCKTNQLNEQVLESHLARHATASHTSVFTL